MDGVVVRRVIPSDNSCLFNAVGYLMEHDQHKAPELRQVIAVAVASDPVKYNEAFLGKPNSDYCTWILNPEKWGGYGERVMLLYDGLHYDALAMSPSDNAPADFDQTVFTVNYDGTIGPVEGLVLNLVKDAQRKRRFTDTANFTLRCGVCQIGFVGSKEAVQHAQATGHINFQEYN
ncbi:hypothetical protein KFK09_025350 [Dendrobium nobile]|uniref:Ubiquitin thioesterase OTU n=1 Tax=Dendrobium nobile TaxID=94219 RepID=A0A8T3AGC7_DENNO|nr:hypothetical protein KFK09_025350 [Dendrobium nobile]